MRLTTTLMAALVITAIATPAAAQLGGLGKFAKGAAESKKKFDDITLSEAEEVQLGSDVSGMLRDKYGVVQDKAVTRYVTLVGSALAQKSSRPGLKWTFIVLDTDGINAFAGPGGFVHITRGALALVQNESELAGVLGHEIAHITQKHTVNAITKSNGLGELANAATKSDLLKGLVGKAYENLLENSFDRGQEMDSDKVGTTLANSVGYAPGGMASFLTKLMERNKGLKEPSGAFASHPDAQARQDGLKKVIGGLKPATALVAPRYTSNITYKPTPISAIAQVAPPVYGQKEEKKGGGLSKLTSSGGDKSNNQSVSSAGARGFNPDRDAKGGPIKTAVIVTVTNAEIAEFVKGIA